MSQPSSVEPVNGSAIPDEDEESDDAKSVNGFVTGRGSDARSVSSQHDRTRSTPSGPASFTGTMRRPSSPKSSHHHHSSRHPPQAPAGSSAAKESFLNYFFGQNGPGPLAGASVERALTTQGATAITPIGRDISGGQPSAQTGLLAGKRTLDGANAGSNAAFDMKSLGKHIEAVCTMVAHAMLVFTDVMCARHRRVAHT